jgi:hypothetical protein
VSNAKLTKAMCVCERESMKESVGRVEDKEVSACHTFFRLSNFFGSALRFQTFLSPTTINGTKISFLLVF